MSPVATFEVGEFDIAIVSDGYMRLDAGAVMGIIPRVMWDPILGADGLDEEHRVRLALNCTVVRRGDEVLLIDTGMGNKHSAQVRQRVFPGDYGYLLDSLAELGIGPDEVTAVVNTHLHADHCGWNTIKDGEDLAPTFKNARYFIQDGEYRDASNPNERTRGTYFPDNFQPLATTGQIELVDGERMISDGVQFLPAPGHTEHHAAVVLSSGGSTAIHCGDLVHHSVQLERLAWIAAFDTLPLASLETKRQLLGRAVTESALLISPHVDFPGAGRLVEENGRRRYVQA